MIAAAVALALAAAAVHGTWNVLLKVSGDPIEIFGRATVVAAAVATIAVVPAWLVLGRPGFTVEAAALCFLSATLETVYLWLLSTAYRRGDLSAVYPIARGSAPLIAVAVGFLVIGERIAPLQLVGVGLLLAGILAVTISQSHGRATLPALLTGVAIAAYTSVDRVGVRLTNPWLYAWLLFVLMAIELALSIWIAKRARPTARIFTPLSPNPSPLRGEGAPATLPPAPPSAARASVIGAGMWLGYFLVLWALSLAPLAVVAPVRETSVVAVAVWGVWRLRERDRAAVKLSGAFVTLAGVALLAV